MAQTQENRTPKPAFEMLEADELLELAPVLAAAVEVRAGVDAAMIVLSPPAEDKAIVLADTIDVTATVSAAAGAVVEATEEADEATAAAVPLDATGVGRPEPPTMPAELAAPEAVGSTTVEVPTSAAGVAEPVAAAAPVSIAATSWAVPPTRLAKPTRAGSYSKTEKTFFKKASPTTQSRPVVERSISKMAPRQ